MISVFKKANKAERGRVKGASNLGEVIRMQSTGEDWCRQRSQHMLRPEAGGRQGRGPERPEAGMAGAWCVLGRLTSMQGREGHCQSPGFILRIRNTSKKVLI